MNVFVCIGSNIPFLSILLCSPNYSSSSTNPQPARTLSSRPAEALKPLPPSAYTNRRCESSVTHFFYCPSLETPAIHAQSLALCHDDDIIVDLCLLIISRPNPDIIEVLLTPAARAAAAPERGADARSPLQFGSYQQWSRHRARKDNSEF